MSCGLVRFLTRGAADCCMSRCVRRHAKVRKPIATILQGDSTNAIGLAPLAINFHTELDLTGYKATFEFLGFSQTFNDLTPSEEGTITLPVVMTSQQTAELPLGYQNASISIEDASGNRRTLVDGILILVTDKVSELMDGNTIDITINVEGDIEHVLSGITWNKDGTVRSLRDFIAQIGERLGANIQEDE